MRKIILPMLLVAMMTTAGYADVSGSGAGGSMIDNGGPASSSVIIGPSETITNLELSITAMSHSWLGDVQVFLTHVDTGTSVSILDGVGSVGNTGAGDSSDFGGNYDFSNDGGDLWGTANGLNSTTAVPSGDYFATDLNGTMIDLDAAFAGEDTAGTWTLSFFDRATGDVGSWGGWSLNISSFAAPAIPEPTSLTMVALVGMAGLFRRRRK